LVTLDISDNDRMRFAVALILLFKISPVETIKLLAAMEAEKHGR